MTGAKAVLSTQTFLEVTTGLPDNPAAYNREFRGPPSPPNCRNGSKPHDYHLESVVQLHYLRTKKHRSKRLSRVFYPWIQAAQSRIKDLMTRNCIHHYVCAFDTSTGALKSGLQSDRHAFPKTARPYVSASGAGVEIGSTGTLKHLTLPKRITKCNPLPLPARRRRCAPVHLTYPPGPLTVRRFQSGLQPLTG